MNGAQLFYFLPLSSLLMAGCEYQITCSVLTFQQRLANLRFIQWSLGLYLFRNVIKWRPVSSVGSHMYTLHCSLWPQPLPLMISIDRIYFFYIIVKSRPMPYCLQFMASAFFDFRIVFLVIPAWFKFYLHKKLYRHLHFNASIELVKVQNSSTGLLHVMIKSKYVGNGIAEKMSQMNQYKTGGW